MKNWLILIFCLCHYLNQAQTSSIPFQTILTDNQESVLNNFSAELEVNIISNSMSGQIVYSERQFVLSGNSGEIYFDIGTGVNSGATFDEIDWSVPNYVELSIRPDGFNNFFSTGIRQLLSVPYALFALNVSCDDGCPGEPGPKGQDGLDGPIGPSGPAGASGPPSATGPQGSQGVSGAESLRITDTVPSDPEMNEFYIDDGTNRSDGQPGFRFFDGVNWIDI